MIYPVAMPFWVKWIYPSCIWTIPNPGNRIFLSFDDGPTPGVTEWVLEILKQYGAKGNFFCIGNNVAKHQELYSKILSEGHLVGNHTYHHLNGWKVSQQNYFKDITEAEVLIHSPYFRPPYGKCWPWQAKKIKNMGKIPVMWSVLSGDFDPSISREKCVENVLSHMQPGSIVVFHDSMKSEEKIKYALPLVLEKVRQNGWEAERIDYKRVKKIGPG